MFTFIHPSNISLLKQLKLVFMTTAELGDPFIENKRVHRPIAKQPLSDSEFASAMQQNYEALEAHIKSMVTFDYYLQQAKQNRGQIESQLQQQIQRKHDGVAAKEQYEKVAVLRLFKSIHQQGLWESHGQFHTGVAIKINTQHDYFMDAGFQGRPQLLNAIEYDDSRPESPTKQNPFPALLKRPEHFAFEQEWRLIRPVSALEAHKEGELFAKLPKGLIEGIYLGLNASDELIDNLRSLVNHDLQFRGVPLKQLGVSETHLRLVATPLD